LGPGRDGVVWKAPEARVTVGFHSPLPPARTGVADYAGALLRALRERGEVRVGAAQGDVHLYQVGNNQLHRAIYREALARPGVTVLHDAVLQHFFLGAYSEAEYVDEFVYNYGEWHRDRGRQLWRDRAGSATDERYFRYPMLRRIAERSKAVVVHNAGAAAMVRQHAADAEVVIIPHLFDPPPGIDPVSAIEFRRRLGIPLDDFMFGIFGFLRESKRLLQVLEVFGEVRKAKPGVSLLVAGDIISSDLERACRPLFSAPGVYRVPYLAERDFWIAASAIDACINLRVPAAGETSGIAIRMMGLGKPVLLTDTAENAALPKGTFLPVPSGVAERATLFDYICILSLDRILSSELGRMASIHIRQEHSIARVAEMYWELLCKHAGSPSPS
jgi:glycosyltransferase involved in cell wall biosynthesis